MYDKLMIGLVDVELKYIGIRQRLECNKDVFVSMVKRTNGSSKASCECNIFVFSFRLINDVITQNVYHIFLSKFNKPKQKT